MTEYYNGGIGGRVGTILLWSLNFLAPLYDIYIFIVHMVVTFNPKGLTKD